MTPIILTLNNMKTSKEKIQKTHQILSLIQIKKNYSFKDYMKRKNIKKENRLKISLRMKYKNNSLKAAHLNHN